MGKKLHISNLSEDTTEKDLRRLFGRLGRIVSASVSIDAATGRPRGFGFVEMKTEEASQSAIAALDGYVLNGHTIRVGEVRLPSDNQKPRVKATPRKRVRATR
jgi:RNA recognition motif-containing protein